METAWPSEMPVAPPPVTPVTTPERTPTPPAPAPPAPLTIWKVFWFSKLLAELAAEEDEEEAEEEEDCPNTGLFGTNPPNRELSELDEELLEADEDDELLPEELEVPENTALDRKLFKFWLFWLRLPCWFWRLLCWLWKPAFWFWLNLLFWFWFDKALFWFWLNLLFWFWFWRAFCNWLVMSSGLRPGELAPLLSCSSSMRTDRGRSIPLLEGSQSSIQFQQKITKKSSQWSSQEVYNLNAWLLMESKGRLPWRHCSLWTLAVSTLPEKYKNLSFVHLLNGLTLVLQYPYSEQHGVVGGHTSQLTLADLE